MFRVLSRRCCCLVDADVGADVLDQTGQNTEMFGQLEEEDVHFNLSPRQREHFGVARSINAYLREEYHTLHEFLWTTGYSAMDGSMPKWLVMNHDSCHMPPPPSPPQHHAHHLKL